MGLPMRESGEVHRGRSLWGSGNVEGHIELAVDTTEKERFGMGLRLFLRVGSGKEWRRSAPLIGLREGDFELPLRPLVGVVERPAGTQWTFLGSASSAV